MEFPRLARAIATDYGPGRVIVVEKFDANSGTQIRSG